MRLSSGPFREQNELIPYWSDGKCGFKKGYDSSSYEEVPCRYESYTILSGYTVALKYRGRWGVLNQKNKVICDFIFDRIEMPSSWTSLCAVMKDGKWGLIYTDSASYATGLSYDYIKHFSVKKIGRENGRHDWSGGNPFVWTLFNGDKVLAYSDGAKMIFPRGFEDIKGMIYGEVAYIIIQNGGKLGLLNFDGDIVTPCEYDSIKQLTPHINRWNNTSFRFALVKKRGKYGILDETGSILLDCEFDAIKTAGDALLLKHNNKWGVLPLYKIRRLENKS